MREYLRVKEAADMLDITTKSFYKLLSESDLPRYQPGGKIILIKRSELDSFISESRVKTQSEVETELFSKLGKKLRK